MKKCLSTQIADIMDQVDKCKVLIELLEHKNSDNDWQLGQTLAVMKGMLTPAISQLVEISDDLWKKSNNGSNNTQTSLQNSLSRQKRPSSLQIRPF